MRYAMQMTELEIAIDAEQLTPEDVDDLLRRFHDAHAARYGASEPLGATVEFVHWRVVAVGKTPPVSLAAASQGRRNGAPDSALKGERRVWLQDAATFASTRVYDGNALGPEMTLIGPAVVDDPYTTVVLPAATELTVSSTGSYLISLG
jgi:N-methylhydantoinase A